MLLKNWGVAIWLLPIFMLLVTCGVKAMAREDMKLSEKGKELIEKYEGVKREVYRCSAGKLTAGVGHVLSKEESIAYKLGAPVEMDQIAVWFWKDVEKAEQCVNNWVVVDVSQQAFDALVSFVFNVGCEAFKKSTLLRHLNKGAIKETSAEFNRWVNAGGKRLRGLVARRAEESRLFMEGESNTTS